jgi:hypothetical protein
MSNNQLTELRPEYNIETGYKITVNKNKEKLLQSDQKLNLKVAFKVSKLILFL